MFNKVWRTALVLAVVVTVIGWRVPVIGAEPQWGSLQGRVVYGGEPPVRKKLVVDKEKDICSKTEMLSEELLVDPKDRGLANVFVWLRRAKDQELRIHPERAKEKDKQAVWKIERCRFEPHAMASQPQHLIFRNLDPVGYSADVRVWASPPNSRVLGANDDLKRELVVEPFPMRAYCPGHPWMSGWILIQDHPYFAITDQSGYFTIDKIPAGEWTFVFWHESFGFITKPKVGGEQQDWQKGRKMIRLTAAGVDLGEVVLAPETRQPQ